MSAPISKEAIVRILNILIHKITVENSSVAFFKIRQLTSTIKILGLYPGDTIVSPEDIKSHFLDNGHKNPTKLLKIIKEYAETGNNKEAVSALADPRIQSVLNLIKIYAIGPSKAKVLYSTYNIKTIHDLRAAINTQPGIINKKQTIGVNYYEELLERIPRHEIDVYNEVLLEICHKISPELKMSINGSYRRGQSTSGDIDILITSKHNTAELRALFIKELKRAGIIVEVLASGKKKFMGITKLTARGFTTARHMDIIHTTFEEYPFGVLYFTGSGGFNSHMRGIAIKQGYSMNEYRITDRLTQQPISSEIINAKIGKSKFETEQDIFTFLDITYVIPSERINLTLSKVIK
tara:strand:+ start:1846 stop:2898 length:1053 start_codon:yes stop_codon:yes gene_type:complete